MTTRRRFLGLTRGSRGQSLVEFAMVLPLLLVVGFLITEFGRALWVKNMLSQTVREGARMAVVNEAGGNPAAVEARAKARCDAFLVNTGMNPAEVTIEAQVMDSDGNGTNDVLRVRAMHSFSFVPQGTIQPGPFATGRGITFPTIPIRSEVIMHLEGTSG